MIIEKYGMLHEFAYHPCEQTCFIIRKLLPFLETSVRLETPGETLSDTQLSNHLLSSQGYL